jgi:hypothetical protein
MEVSVMGRVIALMGVALAGFSFSPTARGADDGKLDVQETVRKGLDWLAKSQHPNEGHWEANGNQYPTTMTGLAGMCFLLEGSTVKEGKYCKNIAKARDWYLKRSQPSGLLGNPNNPTESSRYMYGQGFGTLFLASVYGEEDDEKKRKDLEKLLTKAVLFICKAQTDRGGWGYVSAADGNGFDEGSVTITQLQALRAARNAGIHVPKGNIDRAVKYLKDCTTPRGGIIYSLAHGGPVAGGERPPLTAAAVACSFSSGDYNSDYAKKWIKYCKDNIPFGKGRLAHDEYQNYYFSQCMYILGDDGYAKLFPNDKDPMRWSDFRKTMFEYLKTGQSADGSWGQGGIGTVYTTSINLTILQLENATLPIYQR